jgi:hypothetical protein
MSGCDQFYHGMSGCDQFNHGMSETGLYFVILQLCLCACVKILFQIYFDFCFVVVVRMYMEEMVNYVERNPKLKAANLWKEDEYFRYGLHSFAMS